MNENEFVFEGDLATCAENYEVSADTKTKVSYDSKYLLNFLDQWKDVFVWSKPIWIVKNNLDSSQITFSKRNEKSSINKTEWIKDFLNMLWINLIFFFRANFL